MFRCLEGPIPSEDTRRADAAGPARRRDWVSLVGAISLSLGLAGCGGGVPGAGSRESTAGRPLAIDVFADTAEVTRLDVKLPPPQARVWLARVETAPAGAPDPPLPEAAPESPAAGPLPPPRLEIDERLKPPILKRSAPLRVAGPALEHAATVELEVRVDRFGRVARVRWAGGVRDTAVVRAATECAWGMEFYPALLAGEPVEVWCRQRFDFGAP